MSKAYIINTNKKYNSYCELEMLKDKKCAAYYSPYKEAIDKIQVNDLVFLYSNEVGIIARGVASGIPELKDYEGKTDEEHYMELDRFKELRVPLKASKIIEILDKNLLFNQTQKSLVYDEGLKIWQYITKNCL